MRIIRLSTDYDCYPLWEASPGLAGDIDPHSLPISEQLCARLLAWARTFDETLDRDNPVQSGFRSNKDRKSFEKEGDNIYFLLRNELGEDFKVIRKSIRDS